MPENQRSHRGSLKTNQYPVPNDLSVATSFYCRLTSFERIELEKDTDSELVREGKRNMGGHGGLNILPQKKWNGGLLYCHRSLIVSCLY